MKDAKHLHDQIKRDAGTRKYGVYEPTGEHALYWMMVGACITLGIWFLVTGN